MTIPAVFYPMGAVTEKKEEKLEALWIDKNWVAERKYDGARYLVRKENGKVTIVSRNESVDNGIPTGFPVDKTDRVPHLEKFFTEHLPDGTVLDGEIITHENCDSNDVTSIMGSDADKAIRKQEERGYVSYVVFDLLYYKNLDLTEKTYYERRKALETIYKSLDLNAIGKVLLAPLFPINKEEHYHKIVKGGGEGVILKNIHAPYLISFDAKKPKKPQNTWVKVKKYDTFDVVIMDFTEATVNYIGKELDTWSYWVSPNGILHYRENELVSTLVDDLGYKPVSKGHYYGWIGAVGFGQYDGDTLVRIGQTSGINEDMKQFMTDNRESLIGRVIEVGSMRQNKKTGALVHPRFLHFRDDKVKEQCILWED